MKRTLCILAAVIAVVGLSACGQQDAEVDKSVKSSENTSSEAKSSSTSGNEIEGNFYKLTLSNDFTEQKNDYEDMRTWHSNDYDETEFEIYTYDVGNSTYENDTVPKTFDEHCKKSVSYGEEGVTKEEISFDYNDDGKYEEYSVIEKAIYSEGSDMYESEKLGQTIEDIKNDTSSENPPDDVVIYTARKVIVNQNDRSEAITIVMTANENADTDEMQQILDSFQWKK